jgi:DNA-binding transcriptional MerR regulator
MRRRKTGFPPIPTKPYFTTAEVCRLCRVKPHVLLLWETRFAQLQGVERQGKRRRYKQSDVALVRSIYRLLYVERLTIRGARGRLAAETSSHDHIADELRIILNALQS